MTPHTEMINNKNIKIKTRKSNCETPFRLPLKG